MGDTAEARQANQSSATETAKTDAGAGASQAGTQTETKSTEILGTAKTEQAVDAGKTAAVPSEITLKFPEGFKADDKLIAEYKPLAQKFGLNTEQAQGLFDLHVKALQAQAEQTKTQSATEKSQWIEAAQQDKEFGGQAFKANVELANKAFAKAPEALQKLLVDRGLASNPEVVRWFYREAKRLNAEDKLAGANAGTSSVSDADKENARLRKAYPSMFPQES